MTSPIYTWPFFTGSLVTQTVAPTESGGVDTAIPFTVTLDGYTFAIEAKESRWGAQDNFRDAIVPDSEASDAMFNARGAWARYRYNWAHGGGQGMADLDKSADPYRFDTSEGLLWHEPYSLTLQPSCTLEQSASSSAPLLAQSGAYVFMADGATLYRTSDLDTWTTMTAPGGTIQALSTDGTDLYVATSTGLVRYVGTATTSTAFATPVTGNCTNVAFCSGRLIVGIDDVLSEVASAGTLTTIKNHFQNAFRWTTLFNVGSRIYVGGYAGVRSELYTVTTDSSGNLVQAQEAAPLPIGELLRTGVSYGGVAMLCTNKGIRLAEVSGEGVLTYGPLITEPGDVKCAVGDDGCAFFGWSAVGADRSGVGRMVLTDEVAPLQPAYGPDVTESATQASVTGVARFNGRTVFAVASSGAWVESASAYVSEGHLDSGRVAFGTVEPKGLVGISLDFAPLAADQAVAVAVRDDDGVLISYGVESTLGARRLEVDLGGEQVSFAYVRVELSGPGTSSPVLYRWRIRGYPIVPPVHQWLLALHVAESVVINDGEGQNMPMDVNGAYDWIEGLWGTRQYTILRIGERSYRVRCDNFELRPTRWMPDGRLLQGLLVVQLVNA